MKDLDPFITYLREADRSPLTIAGYTDDLRDFGAWFEHALGEPLTPAAVTPSDVRAYRAHLLDARALRPATINRRLASLAAYARWALAAGHIVSDPTAHIQPVAQVAAGPKWLERSQRFALQRAIEQEWQWVAAHPTERRAVWRARDASLVTLLLHTGVRVAEAARLDAAHLELKPRSGVLLVRGKGTKLRRVPLNASVRTALTSWLAVRPETPRPETAEPLTDTPVFLSQFLQRLTPRSIERVVMEYGHKAKLTALTPHQLRHTFAKTLLDRGVPLDQVGTLLGHANLNTTRIYTRPGALDLQHAVDLLEDE